MRYQEVIGCLALFVAATSAAKECWSEKFGYPCCPEGDTIVRAEDANGKWGSLNDEWCGLVTLPDPDCWSEALGYKCCPENAEVILKDEHGSWGSKNGTWCGIIGSSAPSDDEEDICPTDGKCFNGQMGCFKKYDSKLVDEIHNSNETVDMYGIKVHLKKSPTRKGPGYMDPFEYKIYMDQQQSYAPQGDENTPQAQEEQPPMDPSFIIPIMRDMMGFANINLNTKEIITKFETLKSNGNEFGVWNYKLRRGSKEPKPALIYVHGGAWLGGSAYAVENQCKLIAEMADAVVFNIEYDLCPEVKYPNNMLECYDAVKHIYENAEAYGVDKSRITIAGDSAGGNLCAAMQLKDRDDKNGYINQTILLYPAVTFGNYKAEGYDWTEDVYEISKEHETAIKGNLNLGLPTEMEGNFQFEAYFEDLKQAEETYASPMLEKDFKGVSKTIILTAEYDGLRQQGEFYGSQLTAAGVDTTVYRYQGCVHAYFDKLGFIPQTEEVCKLIAENL